ncbi:MAG TPA: hypothetical protein VIF13_09070 [Hyphomicrobium sp.]|jgi:hypothetical protein
MKSVTAYLGTATRSRLTGFLIGVGALGFGICLGAQPSLAKHRKEAPKLPWQADVASDPCVKMNDSMNKRLEQMRILKKTIDKEQSAPNTMEGVFDLMQGKTYLDHEKLDKMARMRRDADEMNNVMRGTGCTQVDIDREMTKPPTPTVR